MHMSNERRRTVAGRLTAALIVTIALALGGTATAVDYFVSGGGGQLAIGNGLPLPIQVVPPDVATTPTGTKEENAWNANRFPPLLVPVDGTPIITGTPNNLVIPPGVLKKAADTVTLGVFAANDTLYAVRTNLAYSWPAAQATFSTQWRTGAATVTYSAPAAIGGTITYKDAPTGRFGGPANFRITGGVDGPQSLIPGVPVTVFAVAVPGPGNPPCTHTALGGPNPACVAALVPANPNDLAVVGGAISSTGTTMGVAPVPGIVVGKFGADPLGTVEFVTFTPAGNPGATNNAQSVGYPWTAGQIVISAPAAAGTPEFFTLSGRDDRLPDGRGTVQLVAGGLSARSLSDPNGNRGWLSLTLLPTDAVPTMNEWARIATMGLIVALTVGFLVLNRRRSVTE